MYRGTWIRYGNGGGKKEKSNIFVLYTAVVHTFDWSIGRPIDQSYVPLVKSDGWPAESVYYQQGSFAYY